MYLNKWKLKAKRNVKALKSPLSYNGTIQVNDGDDSGGDGDKGE